MATKKEIIEYIFKKCEENNNFIFDNNFVKDVLKKLNSSTNPYDITKLDNTDKYPEYVKNKNYALIHLGNGKHQFIKVLDKLYPEFEEIKENEKINFLYRPSLLKDFSISESSILLTAFNHRIIHDFLYSDIVSNPKIYISERKRGINFEYFINNIKLKFHNLQIEIDLTTEYNGCITVFEAKNVNRNWIKNFNIYQLYNPYRYYYDLKQSNTLAIKNITACYLLRKKIENTSIIRLYLYTFKNPLDITTLKLIKKREYILKKRELNGICQ
jgi:hypothetical protein